MSYPDPQYGNYNGGPCPASHPIALITLFYEFHFDTSPYDDRNFVFAQGDKTGHGFHGDFGKILSSIHFFHPSFLPSHLSPHPHHSQPTVKTIPTTTASN